MAYDDTIRALNPLRELLDNTIFHLTHNYLTLCVTLLYLCSKKRKTCKEGKKLHKIVRPRRIKLFNS